MRCDLCGTTARCLQKDIEGKEFDLCEDCWRPFAERLGGKGREKHPGDPDHRVHVKDLFADLEEYEEVVY
jgi:ribosome-binding protein aMBF1 (putative translation factor)